MSRSKLISVFLAVVLVLCSTVGVFAASPYKDVTKKSVGKNAYTAVTYIKAHHGYNHVIKGSKFKPNKKMTRRDFLMVLGNLYGYSKVPVSLKDIRYANSAVTEAYACEKMVALAEKGFGMSITWDGGKKKLSRALASQYIKSLIDFDEAFVPKK